MPKFTKTDFSRLIPDPDQALAAMQNAAPEFTRCPRGHKLPHRVDAGICFADFCADTEDNRVDAANDAVADPNKPMAEEMDLLPRGMENLALQRSFNGPEDAARHQARSAEAMRIANAYGIEQARALVHNFPFVPKPPSDLIGDDYYDARLKQIGPYILEKMIFLMMFGTPEEQRQYTFELAERFRSKKTEAPVRGVPAVQLIVQAKEGSQVAVFNNPYDQQLQPRSNKQGADRHAQEAQQLDSDPQALVREYLDQQRRRLPRVGSGEDPGSGRARPQRDQAADPGAAEVHARPGEAQAGDQGVAGPTGSPIGQEGDREDHAGVGHEDPLPGIQPFWSGSGG